MGPSFTGATVTGTLAALGAFLAPQPAPARPRTAASDRRAQDLPGKAALGPTKWSRMTGDTVAVGNPLVREDIEAYVGSFPSMMPQRGDCFKTERPPRKGGPNEVRRRP